MESCVQALPAAPDKTLEVIIRTAAELSPYQTKEHPTVDAVTTSQQFLFVKSLDELRGCLKDDSEEGK